MAEKAVDGAMDAASRDGGRALLALVDAVDPLASETTSLRLTADDVEGLSFAELSVVVSALGTPSSGSTSHVEAHSEVEQAS